jgi:hypothetical protein
VKVKQKIKWRPFREARKFARALGLKGHKEWGTYARSGEKPSDIPACPDHIYKTNGWTSWNDWLDTSNRMTRGGARPFKAARKFVQSLNLKDYAAWCSYRTSREMPMDIPSNPARAYKGAGWVSWPDWLGNNNTSAGEARKFKEARKFVHTLNLRHVGDWNEYRKSADRPRGIPSNPNKAYETEGWVDWADWLGKAPRVTRIDTVLNPDFLAVGLIPSSMALRILSMVGKPSDQSLSEALTQLREMHKTGFGFKKKTTRSTARHIKALPEAIEQMRLPAEEHASLVRYLRNYYISSMHKDKTLRKGVLKADGNFAAMLRKAYRLEARRIREIQRETYHNGEHVNYMQALAQVDSERGTYEPQG